MSADLPAARIDLAHEAPFDLGQLDVRPAKLEVAAGDRRETLEPRIMQVLVALARQRGEVVSREDLIQSCWAGRIVGEDSINRCISRLRRLSEAFGGFAIETVPRVGYRLNGIRAALAHPAPAASGKASIAVLPFANLSDAPGQDYFADGMVEEIATALTRFRSLFVVAGGSGLSLKGQGLTPQEAGRRLGVRYLLDGAVRRAGDRVRISVSLIDARDGVQLWADRFDGAMTDIFSLQDEVALSAAAQIEPQVQGEEIRRAHAKPAADLGAYDLFLRAVVVASGASREALQQAQPLYERCLELDPGNARALVRSAGGLALLAAFGSGKEDQMRALARERVQVALRLAPDDADVLASAALVLQDLQEDLSTVRALADRAIALNPGDARAWRASGAVRVYTDPDIAAERLEHGLRLDPLSPARPIVLTALGAAQIARGHIEEAIALFRESAQLISSYPTNHLLLAACYSHLKRFADASDAAAKFQATSGTDVWEVAQRAFAASDLAGSNWMVSRLSRIPKV